MIDGIDAGVNTAETPAVNQRSSTSFGDFAPEQQIIIVLPSARSSLDNMESRWSGIPEITRVSQVPQTPWQHEWGTAIPASSSADKIVRPKGMGMLRPVLASSTMRPPAVDGSSRGITPFISMIRRLVDLGKPWELHYGARSRRAAAFLDLLAPYDDRVHLTFEG